MNATSPFSDNDIEENSDDEEVKREEDQTMLVNYDPPAVAQRKAHHTRTTPL